MASSVDVLENRVDNMEYDNEQRDKKIGDLYTSDTKLQVAMADLRARVSIYAGVGAVIGGAIVQLVLGALKVHP
jgi:hypothetical protein